MTQTKPLTYIRKKIERAANHIPDHIDTTSYTEKKVWECIRVIYRNIYKLTATRFLTDNNILDILKMIEPEIDTIALLSRNSYIIYNELINDIDMYIIMAEEGELYELCSNFMKMRKKLEGE